MTDPSGLCVFSTVSDGEFVERAIDRVLADSSGRFEIGLRKAGFDWFRLGKPTPALIDRRTLLANRDRQRVWLEPGAESLAGGLAGLFPKPPAHWNGRAGAELVSAIALDWPHDFALMTTGREMVMAGGSVCFPSSWRPEEKLGRPLLEIHQPVPGLNSSLAPGIDRLLRKLAPGAVFERENWGLASNPEPDLHPSLKRSGLAPDPRIDSTWLRLEHQALATFLDAPGFLFAIGLSIVPVSALLKVERWRLGLHRALEALPADVAGYKGLEPGRRRLMAQLTNA